MKLSEHLLSSKSAICLFILIAISSNLLLFAQSLDYNLGVIVDSVAVADSKETFTLYLPEKYNKNESSGIVFIFEPAARGRIGILPFVEAAEKYNYILVCSNDSRNGPYHTNQQIFVRLSNIIFDTFKIKEEEIYTAGFSGGARFATALAVLNPGIQGVVGCGAGFPPNRLNFLTMSHVFNYVGLVGNRDMNYQEVQEFSKFLTEYKVSNEIITSNDNHKWPSSSDVLRAFDWLELRAYKENRKPIDEVLLLETFSEGFDIGKSLEDDSEFELSVIEYERLVRNFSQYYLTDSIFDRIRKLKKTKQYKKQLQTKRKIKVLEDKIRTELELKFDAEINSMNIELDEDWWKKKLAKNIKSYDVSNDINLQMMAERIRYAIYAMAIERSYGLSSNTELQKIIYCHKLIAIIVPENSFHFVRLAIVYANRNDKTKVIEYLKMAVSKGFTNKDYILRQKEFLKFIEDFDFKNFMDSF